jgi:hypothetical protein
MNVVVLGKMVPTSDQDEPDDCYLVRCDCGEGGFVSAANVLSGSVSACPTCTQMEATDLPKIH